MLGFYTGKPLPNQITGYKMVVLKTGIKVTESYIELSGKCRSKVEL
jgi:hypothetical protein